MSRSLLLLRLCTPDERSGRCLGHGAEVLVFVLSPAD